MVTPNRLDPGTGGAADADGTFQWPPPKDDVSALFRVPDGSEPAQANAMPAAGPAPHSATQPAPGITPTAPDPEGRAYLALQESLRQRVTTAESTVQTNHPPARRLERPALGHPPGAWLRSHMFGVAFALLALVAAAEGVYILRDWFRTTNPTSPAAVVDEASLAAAPKVEADSGRGRPKEASEDTGTTGAALGGRLSIRSEPSGAQVSIDGRPYGVTPLTLAAVTPGERRIVLKLDGREVRQTVRVESGGTASVIAPMRQASPSSSASASGWLAIVSVAELDIFENGVLVGSTRSPQVMMPAGLHTLRLVNETLGFERTQQIRVEPDKVARISLPLPESTIHLNAQPWAEVWIDGKSVGETPIGNLPLGIGTHQIVFRHPELGEKTVSTMVKVGAPTRVTVDMRK